MNIGARDMPNIPASKLIEPSTRVLLPTPPMPPPPPKFNSREMPPPPKFDRKPSTGDRNSTATESIAGSVPDTLIKLMEYGDDDDEPEETSQELFKRKSNSAVTPKPFWAV